MRRESDLGNWGHSTVETACPLDCPDSCTLAVTVEQGRIVEIDGIDRQADGGLHVAHLNEIGKIELLRLENKGKTNRRLYYDVANV